MSIGALRESATSTCTPTSVRAELVQTLELDLVGPHNSHAFATELLPEPPHRWYLTGFLVPTSAPMEQKIDPEADDTVDSGDAGGLDDGTPPDTGAAKHSILPSSMGLSVLVADGVESLEVVVTWGDYKHTLLDTKGGIDFPEETISGDGEGTTVDGNGSAAKATRGWRRQSRESKFTINLPSLEQRRSVENVPASNGMLLVVIVREVKGIAVSSGRIPPGTRSVSVFLVNQRDPATEARLSYRTFVFQTCLQLTSPKPFIPRPDLRGSVLSELADEWDQRVGDLQYRDVFEFAVGHGVSATHHKCEDGSCSTVATSWLPRGQVERVVASAIPNVELSMEALAGLTDGGDAEQKLLPLVVQYRDWIHAQDAKIAGLSSERAKTAKELQTHAEHAAGRIEAGIRLLQDPKVLQAFKLANKTMARAARQRDSVQYEQKPEQVSAPTWRPFQLAFILLTMRGIVEPEHDDREIVDLLFFPTGGGKTEAYLGLAAFTMVLRRLRNPGISSAGLSVLMRYTLRLLTLDQLSRASALICAMELEREQDTANLGEWPFEIGLWVGQAATPNRMGHKGYTGPGREHTAYAKTRHFWMNPEKNASPIPLENCPWCGTKFVGASFRLVPSQDKPKDLRVHCANHNCEFCGDRALPIVAVDEPLYRRLPAFLIATVDKFAALPWVGVGCLFGQVDRYDKDGFYGPCTTAPATALPGASLLPPELVIQDELHLISGPLGTIAGLYEVAIDELATRTVGTRRIRPKVIASTATVRRAESQIRALFERHTVVIFPTPGIDRRDSFFAEIDPPEKSAPRLYLGVSAQGRSPKVILLRVALALLSAGQRIYDREGGKKAKPYNPADPYLTLVEYFNSLRELGGSRRIMEDEVRTRLAEYSRRKRLDPVDQLFADREIDYEVVELTSRVPTNHVAEAKRRLGLTFHDPKAVDIALATNMISVGLDIVRLGLMAVFGQPKTNAEYIQTTSRVGRDPARPGLVVTILNVHKPRDRSHYERFGMFHSTFYRGVEATSVTPFSPRALDRALPGALVGLSRNGNRQMTAPIGATQILHLRNSLGAFAERFAERGRAHRHFRTSEEGQQVFDGVLARCNRLLDDWLNIALTFQRNSITLQYQQEVGNAQRLMYEFLHPDLRTIEPVRKKFRANRSMRDVEPNVDLKIRRLNDWGDDQ